MARLSTPRVWPRETSLTPPLDTQCATPWIIERVYYPWLHPKSAMSLRRTKGRLHQHVNNNRLARDRSAKFKLSQPPLHQSLTYALHTGNYTRIIDACLYTSGFVSSGRRPLLVRPPLLVRHFWEYSFRAFGRRMRTALLVTKVAD